MYFRSVATFSLVAPIMMLAACSPAPSQTIALTTSQEAACARGKAALESARQEHYFPGGVAAFNFPNGAICVFSVGWQDKEETRPMHDDARFMAASIGKTIVAAVAVRLIKEGKLGLDDKVSDWLGEREGFDRIPNARDITLRHLLSHSAGIPDHVYTEEFLSDWRANADTDNVISPWSLVEYIFDKEPLFKAGAEYAYTDTGYILLGLVIEKASGRSFYDLAQDYFLTPLHLEGTTPAISREVPGLVQAYAGANAAGDEPTTTLDKDGLLRWQPATEWTGGGFISQPRDLAIWVKAHFSGRSMQHDYLDEVLNGAPQEAKDNGTNYGLGVSRIESPYGPMYGHGGWVPGYRSAAFYLPSKDVSYAFEVNTDIGLAGEHNAFPDVNFALLKAVLGEEAGDGDPQ